MLNLSTNNIVAESIRHLAIGLRQNPTLKYLNLSYNNIGSGVYELLTSINNDVSTMEFLSIKVKKNKNKIHKYTINLK
jgi:hypothetical protein